MSRKNELSGETISPKDITNLQYLTLLRVNNFHAKNNSEIE
jgi:hypothetical protein